jgi:hypothetical protein
MLANKTQQHHHLVASSSSFYQENPTTNLKITLKLSRKRSAAIAAIPCDDSEDDDEEECQSLVRSVTAQSANQRMTNANTNVHNNKRCKPSDFAQLQRDLFELYYRMTSTVGQLESSATGNITSNEKLRLQANVEMMQQQYKELQSELEVLRKFHEQREAEEELEKEGEEDESDDQEDDEDSCGTLRDSLDDSLVDELSEAEEEEEETERQSSSQRRVRIRLDCNQVFIVERLHYVYEEWTNQCQRNDVDEEGSEGIEEEEL